MARTSSAPFSITAAFADSPDSGNPAAVVWIDVDKYADEIYGKLSKNFNQPISSFISPQPLAESTEKALHFDIRYFAPNGLEVPLCGHGTLVAGHTVLKSPYATAAVEAVEFHTRTRGTVTVWKRPGGLLELSAGLHITSEPDRGQYARMMEILRKTFGREVVINYIGFGTHDWDIYLLVEVDEKENLKELVFNAPALKETGRIVHVFTARCSSGPELFHSRMFAPGYTPGDEDPVCGTAHCILTPYWSKKLGLPRGKEILAKQVSARGGDLRLVWDAEVDKIHLKGSMAEVAQGQVMVST